MTSTENAVHSIDPRTGRSRGVVAVETSTAGVRELAGRAADAAPALEALGRPFRVALLRGVADALEAARDDIVGTAAAETALSDTRLHGELTRTAYQARFFADVVADGAYLEAAVDHAADTPMGPGPDLRRMLVPLGPVAVFGAGNFPLAFSVPGGDTVSALAAGNPVLVKAHPSHPATSVLCAEVLERAAAEVGAPPGTLALVHGRAAGVDLVTDPAVRAVGFTGSSTGARGLMRAMERRSEPIPFHGELSGVNPVVITPRAAAARTAEIAAGLAASVTGSGGQLCTKPGVVFVPAGSAGDALVAALTDAVTDTPPAVLLDERITTAYRERTAARWSGAASDAAAGPAVPAAVWSVPASGFTDADAAECFGPSAVIVRYADHAELAAALARVPPSLTGTVHLEPDDEPEIGWLVGHFRSRAGRIVFNQYPTGVLVAWAQTHGGPWPATTSAHTSVGATAIRRFLRPLTWQNAPAAVLPTELRDDDRSVPRRVDGKLVLPG